MIFKDEEDFLDEFLDFCVPFADQLVLVDTGSKDRSLEILAKRGVNFDSFPWVGDFSKAKNFALSKAHGDWILFLDADERIQERDFTLLKDLLPELREEGYFLKVISTRSREWKSERRRLQSVQNHLRLFRNHRGYSYRYKIHEVIVESIEQSGGRTRDLEEIPIYHLGYCDELMQQKIERNIPLIEKDYQQDPKDPRNILYYAYSKMGPKPEVLDLLKEGFSQSHKGFGLELCQAILEWFLDFGSQDQKELGVWKQQMLKLQNPSAAVSILEGRDSFGREDVAMAIKCYEQARRNLNQFPHGKYHHEVLDRLIVLSAMDGEFQRSLEYTDEYIRFHGKTPGIYHLLIKLTYATGDFDRFRTEVLTPPEDVMDLEDRKKREVYSLAMGSSYGKDQKFLDQLAQILGVS